MSFSEHHLTRRVLFYETDLAGIVHFSWYLRYMEEAEHALWRAAGLRVAPPDGSIGFPRVAVACEYLAPLRFEDEFDVHVRIKAMSRQSIKYTHVITRGRTKIATGTMTVVCVAHAPGQPLRAIEIPKDIVDRLRA
jgi:acyl-CoA thioester hydrolase